MRSEFDGDIANLLKLLRGDETNVLVSNGLIELVGRFYDTTVRREESVREAKARLDEEYGINGSFKALLDRAKQIEGMLLIDENFAPFQLEMPPRFTGSRDRIGLDEVIGQWGSIAEVPDDKAVRYLSQNVKVLPDDYVPLDRLARSYKGGRAALARDLTFVVYNEGNLLEETRTRINLSFAREAMHMVEGDRAIAECNRRYREAIIQTIDGLKREIRSLRNKYNGAIERDNRKVLEEARRHPGKRFSMSINYHWDKKPSECIVLGVIRNPYERVLQETIHGVLPDEPHFIGILRSVCRINEAQPEKQMSVALEPLISAYELYQSPSDIIFVDHWWPTPFQNVVETTKREKQRSYRTIPTEGVFSVEFVRAERSGKGRPLTSLAEYNDFFERCGYQLSGNMIHGLTRERLDVLIEEIRIANIDNNWRLELTIEHKPSKTYETPIDTIESGRSRKLYEGAVAGRKELEVSIVNSKYKRKPYRRDGRLITKGTERDTYQAHRAIEFGNYGFGFDGEKRMWHRRCKPDELNPLQKKLISYNKSGYTIEIRVESKG